MFVTGLSDDLYSLVMGCPRKTYLELKEFSLKIFERVCNRATEYQSYRIAAEATQRKENTKEEAELYQAGKCFQCKEEGHRKVESPKLENHSKQGA